MNTDAQCVAELLPRETDELSKGDDVLASGNLATNDALTLLPRNGPSEVFLSQLANIVSHLCLQGADVGAPSPSLWLFQSS